MSPDKKKVVVIGGGIAGAELIRTASSDNLEFTLIEPKQSVECQALYPEYLCGMARLDEVEAPLKPFCDRVGATLVSDRAVRLEEGTVVCSKTEVDYDMAVIATGAAQNYFGIKGVENTFSINTLDETIRARAFLEEMNPERIMIIGSGLTGVESACVLSESLDASIYIIEALTRILPVFSESTSDMVEKALSKKGVNILTSTRVDEITKESIIFADGSSLDCDMAIWTAGIKPSEFIQSLNLPKNRGWIVTDQYLQARDGLFVLGDAAWIEVDGKLATKTALEAERQAKHTAKNLERLALGQKMEKYSVMASADGQVALISLGCDCAVGVYGKMCISMPTKLIYSLKSWIDRSFIRRFR
jgi:NADH dehydrogenase